MPGHFGAEAPANCGTWTAPEEARRVAEHIMGTYLLGSGNGGIGSWKNDEAMVSEDRTCLKMAAPPKTVRVHLLQPVRGGVQYRARRRLDSHNASSITAPRRSVVATTVQTSLTHSPVHRAHCEFFPSCGAGGERQLLP